MEPHSASNNHARRMPLVSLDHRSDALRVEREALERIKCMAPPIVIVGNMGPSGQGKSFMANMMVDLKRGGLSGIPVQERFESSANLREHNFTTGIWMWGEGIPITMADGTKATLVILDGQGTGVDKDHVNDALCVLMMLLCSVVMFVAPKTLTDTYTSELGVINDLIKDLKSSPALAGIDVQSLIANLLIHCNDQTLGSEGSLQADFGHHEPSHFLQANGGVVCFKPEFVNEMEDLYRQVYVQEEGRLAHIVELARAFPNMRFSLSTVMPHTVSGDLTRPVLPAGPADMEGFFRCSKQASIHYMLSLAKLKKLAGALVHPRVLAELFSRLVDAVAQHSYERFPDIVDELHRREAVQAARESVDMYVSEMQGETQQHGQPANHEQLNARHAAMCIRCKEAYDSKTNTLLPAARAVGDGMLQTSLSLKLSEMQSDLYARQREQTVNLIRQLEAQIAEQGVMTNRTRQAVDGLHQKLQDAHNKVAELERQQREAAVSEGECVVAWLSACSSFSLALSLSGV